MAIAYVQGNTFASTGATTGSVAFPGANSAGGLLLAAVRVGSLTSTVACSDSVNGSYGAALLSKQQTTDGHTAYIFALPNCAAGTATVTVTSSVSSTLRFAILEYSGAARASIIDASASAIGATTSISSGSASTTNASDLNFGFITGDGGFAVTPGNMGTGGSANSRQSVATNLYAFDTLPGSTGSYQANGSSSSAMNWTAIFAAIKPFANTLPASTGTYAYTGSAVTFKLTSDIPNLLAASGTYNYIGAYSSSDFNVIAANGNYFYAGQAAALVAVASPVSMSAASGSYSIAAQTAQLTYFVIPAGGFPSLIGQYYWVATLMLQQSGALNPATIGYFGTDPITLKWQKSPLPGGAILAQSVAPGTLNFKTNSPITLTVSEYPMGAVYPGGGTLTGGVA